MNIIERATSYCDAHRERVKQRILYGLRYSGLSTQWGCAILLAKFLGVLQRKMNLLLVKMHNSSVVTANRIWDKREQLGQEDQVGTTDDQHADVIELNPDKVIESVEASEGLIVGESAYETDTSSEKIHTC